MSQTNNRKPIDLTIQRSNGSPQGRRNKNFRRSNIFNDTTLKKRLDAKKINSEKKKDLRNDLISKVEYHKKIEIYVNAFRQMLPQNWTPNSKISQADNEDGLLQRAKKLAEQLEGYNGMLSNEVEEKMSKIISEFLIKQQKMAELMELAMKKEIFKVENPPTQSAGLTNEEDKILNYFNDQEVEVLCKYAGDPQFDKKVARVEEELKEEEE